MNVMGEIKAWLDDNIIGARPLDDDLKASAVATLREMIAQRVECEPEEVEFTNPRWEGTTFVADGYTYPLQTIHVTFSIDAPVRCGRCEGMDIPQLPHTIGCPNDS